MVVSGHLPAFGQGSNLGESTGFKRPLWGLFLGVEQGSKGLSRGLFLGVNRVQKALRGF